MDLSGISTVCKDSILQKMDVNTISRFRKTNKSSDNYVEKTRFRRKTKFRDYLLVLKITIKTKLQPKLSHERRFRYRYKHSLSFFVTKCQVETHALSDNLADIPQKQFIEIHDPYLQLSAIDFDIVFLDYPEDYFRGPRSVKQKAKRELRQEFDKLFPLLEKLKISTEWLCTRSGNPIRNMDNFLKMIAFEKIFSTTPCSPETMEVWPINHCTEAYCLELSGVPNRVSPIFLSCSSAAVGVYSTDVDEETKMDRLIRGFVKDIKRSRESRGCLNRITFEAEDFLEITDIPELVIIWKGFEDDDPAKIYRFNIDEGFAYIYSSTGYCDFRFLQEEIDAEIIASFKEEYKLTDDDSFVV